MRQLSVGQVTVVRTLVLVLCVDSLIGRPSSCAAEITFTLNPSVSIPGDGNAITVALSDDGSRLFVGEVDEQIVFIDTTNGRRLLKCDLGFPIWGLAPSPDGSALCVSGPLLGGRIKVLRCDDASVISTREVPKWSAARCIQFAPKGNMIAVSIQGRNAEEEEESDVEVMLWDYKSKETTALRHVHERRINAIAFSPDGKRLATAADDMKVREWALSSGELVADYVAHSAGVCCVAYSADGKWIASGGADSRVVVWDVETRRMRGELREIGDKRGWITAATFVGGGKYLVTCDGSDEIVFIDPASVKIAGKLRTKQGDVRSVAVSAKDDLIASIDIKGGVKVWSIREAMERVEALR